MSRRTKLWTVAAAMFTVANVGGAIFAAWGNEIPHAAGHGVLAIIGVFWAMWLTRRLDTATDANEATSAGSFEVGDRLSNLERSIDVVAIEVERVGEGQRFMTELLTKKADERVEKK